MVTQIIQARLPEKQVKIIDKLVERGLYSSRSDFIKYAIRMQGSLDMITGLIADENKDSVKEIRKIREKLSRKDLDIEELNSL